MKLDLPSMRTHYLAALPLMLPALAGAETTVPSQSLGGSIAQLIFGLAIVLVLMFATLWLLKRLSAPRGNAAGLMRVVAGTAVGARERVVVVEVGSTWLVLGVAPGRVSALAEMPRVTLPSQSDPPPAKDFAGRLKTLLNHRHAD
jgi:flagellar protein FliO/FliZ